MSNLKQKPGYRALALIMAVLMFFTTIPATAIALALEGEGAESDTLAPQNLQAEYKPETDKIVIKWDSYEPEIQVDELKVVIDTTENFVDTSDVEYSTAASAFAGGEHTVQVIAIIEGDEHTSSVNVELPYNLVSIGSISVVTVENDLTIAEIVDQIPDDVELTVDGSDTPVSATVTWSTEGTKYDKAQSGVQTFTVEGRVELPENIVNRDSVDLEVTANIKVNAAIDVSIDTDLDDSSIIEKKVGESLVLSIEASGTAPSYQWYRKAATELEGTEIVGATAATLNVESLSLDDNQAQYYCVVNGKTSTIDTSKAVTSKAVTVNVSKVDVDLQLKIDPTDGQTRPNTIDIYVLNIPSDAKGTVTIKQGADVLHEVQLDGTNSEEIKYTFKATGASDSFVFSALYSGDDEKYNGSDVSDVPYDFTKGNQEITGVDGIPSDIKALDEFTVTPQTNLDPVSDKKVIYKYEVSDDTVASIDENGKVTTKKQGSFEIIITAVADYDYNADVYKTDEIDVEYATRSGIKFNESKVSVQYFSGFSYAGMGYTDTSKGKGELVYSIVSAPSDLILIDQNGVITFSDTVDPFNKDLTGLIGDVVVRLTKQTDDVYEEIYDEYTLTITIADQAALSFAQENISVTYTADAEGNPLTTGQNVATGGSVNANVVYSIETGNDVIELDKDDGSCFTAIKPGTATVKATIPGNTFYKDVTAEYKIVVGLGTVEGFKFTSTEEYTTMYGVKFENAAKGGQKNSNEDVTYEIVSVSDAIKEYAKVDTNGIVYFDGYYALAADAAEYEITVKATKLANEYYKACPIEYTLSVTRDSVNSEADFTVNGKVIKDAQLLTSPDGWYNAEHSNITIKPDGTKYTSISENGMDWSGEITRGEDKKYAISFYLKNETTGAVSFVSTQSVNYDTTVATAKLTVVDDGDFWTEFLETITFGLWKNESKKVLIEAEDNLSGIMSIEYYEQNDNFDQYTKDNIADADIAWTQCSLKSNELKAESTVDVELKQLSNKKVVIYAKVTDYAGNVSYFRTDGMIFDSITPDQETELPSPIINIELPGSITEGLYNGEVPFKLTVNDQQTNSVASGIKTIKVTITGSNAEEYSKVINVSTVNNKSEISKFDSSNVNSNEFTVDNTFVVPANFDSNYLTILVEVEDFAGNKYTNSDSLTHLAIDVTNPEISVSYDDDEGTFSNGKYIGNNKNRVATINITELNFDNSDVAVTVIQDGKKLDIQPNFTPVAGAVDENGDQIEWQMKINYATLGEGEFDFDIEYTDKATNKNNAVDYGTFSNPQNFIIDNTKPVITVEISNDSVANDKYFADTRIATVTIVERNFSENYQFDWSGLTFTLDGVAQTAPVPRITRNDNGTYVRVYTIDFSAEGDYTFDVKYTDLADNVADTYSCNSVSYKEFTVDKTAPALEITGVADKSANNGTVAPVITYSDINFNEDAVSIVLFGVNNGFVDYSGTYANIEHGQTFTYANFKEEQSVDDIYILTATLTDMAGNETTKTISFSANRFGSVYDIRNLESINGKYLQSEQDLVFTETNVDSLDRQTLSVKLTKNGTPIDLVEGRDYTIVATGGDGQWSQYEYTINKTLFADDGRYSISVYSVDAAGNVNENIDETKAAEISFGIDKTKPVIVPIDFENGVQYPVEVKTVEVEIKDNLVLEGVKIYLNGTEVEYDVNGETYSFDIPERNSKQDVRIVAVDAAGNEHEVVVEDFLVSTNLFVRWYNNTPLFVGSIVGVLVIAIAAIAFILFGKKKKKEDK